MSGKKQNNPVVLTREDRDCLTEVLKRGEHTGRERERSQM
jgi:hypothetical protein